MRLGGTARTAAGTDRFRRSDVRQAPRRLADARGAAITCARAEAPTQAAVALDAGAQGRRAAGRGQCGRAVAPVGVAQGASSRRAGVTDAPGAPARETAAGRADAWAQDAGQASARTREAPARAHPWFALLVAAGVALGLAIPCAAWASEATVASMVERQAACAADELLASGVEAGTAAAGPKAALDDNDLPAEAAERAAAEAAEATRAARAAEAAPARATAPSAEAEAARTTAPSAEAGDDAAGGSSSGSASSLPPRTISVAGSSMGYVDSYQSASAPSSGAGLWMGSDSTTDGSWAYFIGHNPGPFHGVMGLGQGAAVTVCDGSGNARTYHVVDVFTVPDTTYWEDIQGRVTGHGESVILQTCVGGHASYRIVVAA